MPEQPTIPDEAPVIKVEFLAQAGSETWTLGEANLTADRWPHEVAAALRSIADEFDKPLKEADHA